MPQSVIQITKRPGWLPVRGRYVGRFNGSATGNSLLASRRGGSNVRVSKTAIGECQQRFALSLSSMSLLRAVLARV